MKISVDDDVCVASGSCVMASLTVFDQDDDGMVVLLNDSPGEAEWEGVRTAAAVCPVAAIEVIEN